jgi:hypothetical protein
MVVGLNGTDCESECVLSWLRYSDKIFMFICGICRADAVDRAEGLGCVFSTALILHLYLDPRFRHYLRSPSLLPALP